jgi:IS30 family transposase
MSRRGLHVPIDKAVLVALYTEQGLSIREVASELSTTTRTVHRRMIGYGIRRRNPGARPGHGAPDRYTRATVVLTRAFLADHYKNKGMTVPEIAEETGFHPSTVRQYFLYFGLEMGRTRAIRLHIDPKQLARLRRAGLTVPEIAARMGCSQTTNERAVRRYGIFRPSRPTLVDRIDPKHLAKLRREGLMVAEIADQLGYSQRNIERALQRYGIRR